MSGHLLLFVCLGLMIIIGIVAIDEFHTQTVNDSNYTSQADAGISVTKPILTVFGYLALTVASIGLIQALGSM